MWDLNGGAKGRFQEFGPLKETFIEGSNCKKRAGQDMCVILVVIDIQSDWPAYVEVAGFRTWSHNKYPCCCCNVPKMQLANLSGVTIFQGPWLEYTEDMYRDELQRNRTAHTCKLWFVTAFVSMCISWFSVLLHCYVCCT
jgi:hypothetical protein